jgi:phosphatidate cytidylyltransferase
MNMHELIQRAITASVLAVSGFIIFFYAPIWATSVILCLALALVLLIEWPRIGIWWLTPLYPILPFLLMILLNQSPDRWLLMLLVLTICAHDTGAYFVGKLCGRHKIAPSISPGKTWEGVFGGFIVSAVVAGCYLIFRHVVITFVQFSFFIFLINAAAVSGDLFESCLKRRAGVKDAGNLLPGHGGLLDRFDSLLFGVIVLFFLFYIKIFSMQL